MLESNFAWISYLPWKQESKLSSRLNDLDILCVLFLIKGEHSDINEAEK